MWPWKRVVSPLRLLRRLRGNDRSGAILSRFFWVWNQRSTFCGGWFLVGIGDRFFLWAIFTLLGFEIDFLPGAFLRIGIGDRLFAVGVFWSGIGDRLLAMGRIMTSLIFSITITDVYCPYCAHPHQDWDKWAVHPHSNHLCEQCGMVFNGGSYGVSRPTFTPIYAAKFNQPPVVQGV